MFPNNYLDYRKLFIVPLYVKQISTYFSQFTFRVRKYFSFILLPRTLQKKTTQQWTVITSAAAAIIPQVKKPAGGLRIN